MAYIFTQEQQAAIITLRQEVEADSGRRYAEIYQLIAELLFKKDIARVGWGEFANPNNIRLIMNETTGLS